MGYNFLEKEIEHVWGTTLKKQEKYEIQVAHKTYESADKNKKIRIHRSCSGGYNAFRSFFKDKGRRLSIFFYRGDSPGGGGSNFYWLGKPRLKNALEVLEDGGLIITDGSNCKIRKLKQFHRDNAIGNKVVRLEEPFVFSDRKFICVGYVVEKYGPTLIW